MGGKDFFKLRVALIIGYNGRAFHGSQAQKCAPEIATTDGAIETALLNCN